MAKKTKKQMSQMGKKIMTEAKKIRAKNPQKKWTTCVKEAGRKFKK